LETNDRFLPIGKSFELFLFLLSYLAEAKAAFLSYSLLKFVANQIFGLSMAETPLLEIEYDIRSIFPVCDIGWTLLVL
jgi:hypothetical protein